MIRATRILRADALAGGEIVDRVVLDHGERHRRRVAMRGSGGLAFLLDLAEATVLEDGDALVLQDGRLVWVEAAPERLLEIRAPSDHALKRLIWHIGNRHIPAEIGADAVWIAFDHVLAEMVRGQGCTATPVERPFRPERGAYDHACGHDHGHHGHGHHHHAHDDARHRDDDVHHHDAAAHHDHEHGPVCGHHGHGGHGHEHEHR